MEIIAGYLLGSYFIMGGYLLGLLAVLFMCYPTLKIEKAAWHGMLLYFALAPIYVPIWIACIAYRLVEKLNRR